MANLMNTDLLAKKPTTATNFWTKREWLQQAYPEWEQKYQLAVELNLEPFEAFLNAVNDAPNITSQLPPTDLVP